MQRTINDHLKLPGDGNTTSDEVILDHMGARKGDLYLYAWMESDIIRKKTTIRIMLDVHQFSLASEVTYA